MRLLLDELIPEIVVIRDQLERRGQAEIMPVVVQQLETKSVNGSEPGPIERGQDFRPRFSEKNLFARALLHFIGRPIRKREDNETR
ncbi:MAG TPA: hypothetical protein VIM09_05900 [Chthoniobacterales bacterium]